MSRNTESFEKAMNEGHNAAWDQLWDQAAGFYRQALEEFPEDPKALTSLALALYESQNYQDALVNYLKASNLTPDDPIPLEKAAELLEKTGQISSAVTAYLKCAELYLKNKEVNKGIGMWTRIVMVRPDHLIARSRLALVYERLGRKPEALREYMAVASILQNAGEVQKAIQAANRALQVEPGNRHVKTAIAMIRAGQLLPKPSQPQQAPTPAVTPSEKKKKTGPQENDPVEEAHNKALTTLAGLLFEQEEPEESSSKRGMSDIVRGAFGIASGQETQTTIMLHISQYIELHSQKNFRSAIEELERAVELGLNHPAALYDLGYLRFKDGRFQDAIDNLDSLENHAEYIFAVKLIQGQSRYQLKKYGEAALDLLEALRQGDMQLVSSKQVGALSSAYDPIIEAHRQQADIEASAQLCDNILKMVFRQDWKKQLSEARQQLPDQDGIYPTSLAEVLIGVGSSEIVEALARVQKMAQSHKLHAAMEEAFFVLNTAPYYLPLHITIADLLLQQGLVEPALAKYATVARSYEVRGESSRSIILYRKIADLSPMDYRARANLITLMIETGQTGAAIQEYLDLAEMYYSLADLENVRQTIQKAFQLAQETNASRADKIKILTQLADIEMQSLNLRQAQRIYGEMRTIQPDHEPARIAIINLHFRLSQTKSAHSEIIDFMKLLIERKQIDRAEAFLAKLIEQYPDEPVILQQQGELLRLAGRQEEAIARLDAAGEFFLQRGDKVAAAEVIRTILAMNPPNSAQYQQLLSELR